MGKRKDLRGQKFGRLTAISSEMDADGRRCIWTCLCDCGNYTTASTVALTHGYKQSCGCIQKELLVDRNIVHGYSKERLYKVWKGMRGRCNNPNHSSYSRYGGRGVTVCEEWNDYTTFRSWAYANGFRDDVPTKECTLDRIDVNKGYSPDNCRWVNELVQANNTRVNRMLTYKGTTKTMAEWARITGIDAGVISARIHSLGWDAEKALSTPVRQCNRR